MFKTLRHSEIVLLDPCYPLCSIKKDDRKINKGSKEGI